MIISDIKDILNFRINYNWGHRFKQYINYSEIEDGLLLKNYFKFMFLPKNIDPIEISNNSNNIFCNPKKLQSLIDFLEKSNHNFSNLVCCGNDSRLSNNIRYLERLRHRFEHIYVEAKNIECDWVQIIPMGMIMLYMLRNGGSDVILPHINKKKNKVKLIATAFGSRWPHLTKSIADRRKLKNFTDNCNFIDDMFCHPTKYFENLCDYRFFACPLGNGIQTPKICECIMCETVPVVTDHVAHRELRDTYDLPLLIVNKWTDLTEQFLNDQWDSVYSKLDWAEQKSKFLVKNFNKLLI